MKKLAIFLIVFLVSKVFSSEIDLKNFDLKNLRSKFTSDESYGMSGKVLPKGFTDYLRPDFKQLNSESLAQIKTFDDLKKQLLNDCKEGKSKCGNREILMYLFGINNNHESCRILQRLYSLIITKFIIFMIQDFAGKIQGGLGWGHVLMLGMPFCAEEAMYILTGTTSTNSALDKFLSEQYYENKELGKFYQDELKKHFTVVEKLMNDQNHLITSKL